MASLTRLPAQAGGGGMAPQSAPGPERRTLSLQRARLFALRATSRACALDVHCARLTAFPSTFGPPRFALLILWSSVEHDMRGAPPPARAPSTEEGRQPVNNGQSAPGSLAAIEVADVVCQFGRIRALDGVSLRVMAGTVVGVRGPNGAGKTTLIDVSCRL